MERMINRFSLSEVGFKATLWWMEHVHGGGSLFPEGKVSMERIFDDWLVNRRKRKMSEDCPEIFAGFQRDFRDLQNIPQAGPVLFLTWHYPKGPLSFWGVPFFINEAVNLMRKDCEVAWIGASRARLPFFRKGFKIAREFWQDLIENCYSGIYIDYGRENNSQAVRYMRKMLQEDGMIGLMPDDIDRTMAPPRKIERLKPASLRIANFLAKTPEISIVAVMPAFLKETNTMSLSFFPLEGPKGATEEKIAEWGNFVKETLTASVLP